MCNINNDKYENNKDSCIRSDISRVEYKAAISDTRPSSNVYPIIRKVGHVAGTMFYYFFPSVQTHF